MRQAKMEMELAFGGLALNVCGDFLQLPPVNKDGSRRSLATATVESEEEESSNVMIIVVIIVILLILIAISVCLFFYRK